MVRLHIFEDLMVRCLHGGVVVVLAHMPHIDADSHCCAPWACKALVIACVRKRTCQKDYFLCSPCQAVSPPWVASKDESIPLIRLIFTFSYSVNLLCSFLHLHVIRSKQASLGGQAWTSADGSGILACFHSPQHADNSQGPSYLR